MSKCQKTVFGKIQYFSKAEQIIGKTENCYGRIMQDNYNKTNKKVYRIPNYELQNKLFIYENFLFLKQNFNKYQ